MEGLLIAEELKRVTPLLPSKRLSWRFPDAYTFILPVRTGSVWLFNRPPNPRIAYKEDVPSTTSTHSGFQDLLHQKVSGDLLSVEQQKLDRVVHFKFGAGEGFVRTEAVTLIAELTGRNCNLILVNENGIILGAAREIHSDINRYRQIRSGMRYQPPPPYEKLDPRTATLAELTDAIRGKSIKKLRSSVDGLGPNMIKTLATLVQQAPNAITSEDNAERVATALKDLSDNPSARMREALELPDVEVLRKREHREAQTQRLLTALQKSLGLLEKRIEDIDKVRAEAARAQSLREQADVLMAFSFQVPKNADTVTLTDFSGEPLTLQLDPKLDAVANAQSLYERAKKRELRQLQAQAREPELLAEREQLQALIAKVPALPIKEIERLVEVHAPKRKVQRRNEPGIRYDGPHGFTVIVGRNAKANDEVTFKLARSRDVWLHVQGYRGSHVIIQAQNKDVPFEVILFAAQLAAAYSQASDSENVPVDYTLRKNVWRPKGAAAGAVHYSQQKTVYVTPSRRPDIAVND